jgi:hypothetical protein
MVRARRTLCQPVETLGGAVLHTCCLVLVDRFRGTVSYDVWLEAA